jgi:hypothetical protein
VHGVEHRADHGSRRRGSSRAAPRRGFIYTVRHTGDAHYGAGISHGDDIYEHGGFAVHFFGERLVQNLAESWNPPHIHPFEEGELPRRLWRITQTLPATGTTPT